jgi:tRNA threonylcarbamoyl adenosine modification protein YeaZ
MDTSGSACQAVVSAGEALVSVQSEAMGRGHGEALVPMVETALQDASVGYEQLDRIGVTVGPGSFTGLRVGLAAARGFAATLNIPVVGIGTLEALAVTDRLESGVDCARAVALDARNGLVYGQRFSADGIPMEPAGVMADIVFAASILPGMRVVGPAQAVLAALTRSANKDITLGTQVAFASPASLAQLAMHGDPSEKPKLLYLKNADAVPAKSAGLRAVTQ